MQCTDLSRHVHEGRGLLLLCQEWGRLGGGLGQRGWRGPLLANRHHHMLLHAAACLRLVLAHMAQHVALLHKGLAALLAAVGAFTCVRAPVGHQVTWENKHTLLQKHLTIGNEISLMREYKRCASSFSKH